MKNFLKKNIHNSVKKIGGIQWFCEKLGLGNGFGSAVSSQVSRCESSPLAFGALCKSRGDKPFQPQTGPPTTAQPQHHLQNPALTPYGPYSPRAQCRICCDDVVSRGHVNDAILLLVLMLDVKMLLELSCDFEICDVTGTWRTFEKT